MSGEKDRSNYIEFDKELKVTDFEHKVRSDGKVLAVACYPAQITEGIPAFDRALIPESLEEQDIPLGVRDIIRVKREGDSPPEVTELVEKRSTQEHQYPRRCPVCHSPVVMDDSVGFCAGGIACNSQLIYALEHYLVRSHEITVMDGESCQELIDRDLITDLPDIYELRVADVQSLSGWGSQSAETFVQKVEETKNPGLSKFLYSLDIPGVTAQTAGTLMAEFDNFGDIYDAGVEADQRAFELVDGVDSNSAELITLFFQSESNCSVIDRLLEFVTPQEHTF